MRTAVDPALVKKTISDYAAKTVGEGTINAGTRGAILGVLNDAVGDEGRHLVLFYLFGHPSSKKLTSAQWFALWKWVAPYKDELGDGRWKGDEAFYIEATHIVSAVGSADSGKGLLGGGTGHSVDGLTTEEIKEQLFGGK